MTKGAASSQDAPFSLGGHNIWVRVSKWIEHSEFAPTPTETSDERYKRMQETQYRTTATPGSWHRYATLRRYVVDSFIFDMIQKEFE